MQAALFLDRDGVINVDSGYVHRPEDFHYVDGIFDIAREARRLGYRLVVITNQAGIARGYYTEKRFLELTDWMCERFVKEQAPIDRVYFSPYHPTEGVGIYKLDHISRKPHPGMILQAQRELDIDLGGSILIGDKYSDIQAGLAAGVGTNILMQTETGEISPEAGDYLQIRALREALPLLASHHQRCSQ